MKIFYSLTTFALLLGATAAQAQDTNAAPINTVPEGITTFHIPATGQAQISTSYFSAPLCNDPMYTGAVSGISTVTASSPDTVSVGDTPAPWTAGQFGNPATPYFLKFLSGEESGRVLQVLSNTSSSLTLDTTDETTQTAPLNTSNFTVAEGDTFEVFAGDTLGLMFGLNTTQSPLVLVGGGNTTADTVNIFNRSANRFQAFYFDTTAGFWKPAGGSANSNNEIIYPYASFLITRRQNQAASTFVLTGRVAEVSHLVKTVGGNTAVYDSTGYPVDVMLSQLKLTNWAKAPVPTPPALPNIVNADTIAVWNSTNNRFDSYFQVADANSTWRVVGGGSTDESSFVIPAGTTVSFLKRTTVSGATSYLQPVLPYSLTN
jgi:uncharacterized protein (TIGR02597 family)